MTSRQSREYIIATAGSPTYHTTTHRRGGLPRIITLPHIDEASPTGGADGWDWALGCTQEGPAAPDGAGCPWSCAKKPSGAPAAAAEVGDGAAKLSAAAAAALRCAAHSPAFCSSSLLDMGTHGGECRRGGGGTHSCGAISDSAGPGPKTARRRPGTSNYDPRRPGPTLTAPTGGDPHLRCGDPQLPFHPVGLVARRGGLPVEVAGRWRRWSKFQSSLSVLRIHPRAGCVYRLPCDGQMCERRERRDKCLGPWKRGVKTAALCRCLHRRRAYTCIQPV